MPTPTYNITNLCGDTYAFTIRLSGDWTTWTPKFEVSLPNVATPVLELTTGSGVTSSYDAGADQTTFAITITAAQSTTLGYTLNYLYDFQLGSGVVVKTYLGGSLSQSFGVST